MSLNEYELCAQHVYTTACLYDYCNGKLNDYSRFLSALFRSLAETIKDNETIDNDLGFFHMIHAIDMEEEGAEVDIPLNKFNSTFIKDGKPEFRYFANSESYMKLTDLLNIDCRQPKNFMTLMNSACYREIIKNTTKPYESKSISANNKKITYPNPFEAFAKFFPDGVFLTFRPPTTMATHNYARLCFEEPTNQIIKNNITEYANYTGGAYTTIVDASNKNVIISATLEDSTIEEVLSVITHDHIVTEFKELLTQQNKSIKFADLKLLPIKGVSSVGSRIFLGAGDSKSKTIANPDAQLDSAGFDIKSCDTNPDHRLIAYSAVISTLYCYLSILINPHLAETSDFKVKAQVSTDFIEKFTAKDLLLNKMGDKEWRDTFCASAQNKNIVNCLDTKNKFTKVNYIHANHKFNKSDSDSRIVETFKFSSDMYDKCIKEGLKPIDMVFNNYPLRTAVQKDAIERFEQYYSELSDDDRENESDIKMQFDQYAFDIKRFPVHKLFDSFKIKVAFYTHAIEKSETKSATKNMVVNKDIRMWSDKNHANTNAYVSSSDMTVMGLYDFAKVEFDKLSEDDQINMVFNGKTPSNESGKINAINEWYTDNHLMHPSAGAVTNGNVNTLFPSGELMVMELKFNRAKVNEDRYFNIACSKMVFKARPKSNYSGSGESKYFNRMFANKKYDNPDNNA